MAQVKKMSVGIKPVVDGGGEEYSTVALYKAMLDKVEEVCKITLQMESGVQLALVLNHLAQVKTQLMLSIERVEMEMEIEKGVKEYEEGEVSNGSC